MFQKILRLILLILFVSPGSDTHGQDLSQTFRGVVLDAYTELPLPGATIIIVGSDPLMGTSTDINGEYRFDKMPLGRFDIRISMMGYKTNMLQNLLLTAGRELVVDIRLEEQVYLLADVEIRPEIRKDQPMNEMAMVSARSFTIDETERYAGSLGDPARMASNFAGVSSASDQRNDIIIRGNSPLGLLWRLEGVEIPNPNHFGSIGSTGGPISMINNNHLDNSDFFTGAFPAEFGNALAGAFDLRMRNGNNQQHEFMGQVGFNGFELGAEGPLNSQQKASYLVNARYSTLELLQAAGMNFGTGTAIPKYRDLSFKVNMPLPHGRLTLFGLGGKNNIAMLDSQDDQAQYGFSGTDLFYTNSMGVMGVNHTYYFSPDSRVINTVAATGIWGTVNIYDLSYSLEQEKVKEDLSEIKYTISSRFFHRFNARNYLNAGVVFDHYDIGYNGREFSERHLQYIQYLNTSGNTSFARVFTQWQHRFSDALSMTTGLHASYLFLNNTYALEPRMGLTWEFSEDRSMNIGWGLHSQTQMKAVYFAQRLTDTLELSYEQTNRNLDMSRSLHLVAGYNQLLGEGHRLTTEIYYQHLYSIPVAWRRPEFSLLSQGGAFTFWAFDDMENLGSGENKGVELTLEKFLHKGFYYLFTASVFDAGYRGYDGIWRNSAFNNNFIFNVLSGYEWKTGRRSTLAADIKAVYAGGNRYLEIDAERSVSEGGTRYNWTEAYEKRHPDYFRLNARITFRLNGNSMNQEWALDLQNITNHQNVFVQNWDNDKKEVSTSYQTGFMPMVTYRIYF